MKFKLLLSNKKIIECDDYSTGKNGLYYTKGTLQVYLSNTTVLEELPVKRSLQDKK